MDPIIFNYTLYSIQAANFHDWPALVMEAKHPDKVIGPNDYEFFQEMVIITTPKPGYFSMN